MSCCRRRRSSASCGRWDGSTSTPRDSCIWSTDGTEIQRLTHPKRAVPRTYQAALAGPFAPLPTKLVLDDGHEPKISALEPLSREAAHPSLRRPRRDGRAGDDHHRRRRVSRGAPDLRRARQPRARALPRQLRRPSSCRAICRRANTSFCPGEHAANERACTSSSSSRRSTGTPATPGGPAWRWARSCISSGRSASRSTTAGAPRRARLLAAGPSDASGRAGPNSSARCPSLGSRSSSAPRRRRGFPGVSPTRARPCWSSAARASACPPDLLARHRDATVADPDARPELRSLNLSTSVALAAYEARRQWGCSGSLGRRRRATASKFGRRTSVARPSFSSSRIVYQPMSS